MVSANAYNTFTTTKQNTMNKEQLLETLKGLTTALETSTDTPNEESLRQAFLCGARFIIDDLSEMGSVDYTVYIEAQDDDGNHEQMTLNSHVDVHRAFMHQAGIYDSDPIVQAEKYCEKNLSDYEIRNALQKIKLIPEDIQPQNPTA